MNKLFFVFVAFGLLQGALVAAGVLPPVSSYAAENIALSVVLLALAAYAGWKVGKPKEAAMRGAMLMGGAALALCVVGMIAKPLGGKPVLGISVPSAWGLPVVFATIILLNAAIGAAVAAAAAFVAGREKRK